VAVSFLQPPVARPTEPLGVLFHHSRNVAMPAVRQKWSKLSPTVCQAASTIAVASGFDVVIIFFMALLSFMDSTPGAYRLEANYAAPPISTSVGTFPIIRGKAL
jgi:hypothetical protein